jgi:hypothetical protein
VTLPLVFRHGGAETVLTIAVLVWLVFAVMAAEINCGQAGSPADTGARK